MTGALSDEQLDEATALLARLDAVPSMGYLDNADLGWVRPVLHDLLDEIRRLRGERGDLTEKLDAATKTAVRLAEQRDHLVSAFDKLSDQMGELVQAARSERERYTAENQRLRAELADAAGYLAAIHRHASRHDVLGKNLGCAGCALLARIEGAPAEPDRVPPRTPTPGRTDAHFSPGYTGEIPDHHGVFETCAMPACVTSRAQHENGGEP